MAKQVKRIKLANSTRQLPKGGKVVGAADDEEHIEISVRIRPKPAAKFLDDQIMALGREAPSQRQYLSREEFAAREGADPADVAKIDDFAHQHGLTVKSVHLASRTVKLDGTVRAFSNAFGVKLSKVKHRNATFRMRKGAVLIPENLKDIIIGVHGLDNRPVATPHFRRARERRRSSRARAATDATFAVTEIAKLYKFPAGLTGAGQCVAIIELNDIDNRGRPVGAGYKTADLQAFFKQVGIPIPNVVPVGVDGGGNRPGKSEADGEVVLDIEVAGAVAPGAKIAVYFAPNTTNGFIDAVKAAAHDTTRRPAVISISWGGPEDPNGQLAQQFLDGLNEAIRDAAAMGVTVCVAAGDNGSADMGQDWDGKPHTDFPASSLFALACGGTKLHVSNGGITDETVWNEGTSGGAGGGGISNYFQLPTYQHNANVPKSPTGFGGRGVPDVAGNADPATGYQIFLNGSWTSIGGTSAVAPLMAGLIALINEDVTKKFGKTVGFINPLIYAANSLGLFRDVIEGNNDIEGNLRGKYTAAPGWDACSGLGVADGTSLLELLSR